MRQRQLQVLTQELQIDLKTQNEYDNLFIYKPELAFLPNDLIGQVSGKENRARNKHHGSFASAFLEKQIEACASENFDNWVKGKNLVHYGWGLNYDAAYIQKAIHHDLYVEIRDISNKSCEYACEYIEQNFQDLDISYQPTVYVADLRHFRYLDHHETISLLYLGRILGLLRPPDQRRVVRDIGECLFQQDDPGSVVIIQAFKDDNKEFQEKTVKMMYVKELLSLLSKGAKRSVEIKDEAAWDYYHKKCRALRIAI